ncbi:BING4CT protein [Rhizoctonia solani]|uniref:U three protein 7 n=1 Tax=Rhizoctonia solani TaxID=456999 RepID=A0A8H7M9K6_9AGAM|nr:BING4CT protein [Rhizoctonia solani]
MDALTAAADAIKPLGRAKKSSKKQASHGSKPQKKRPDATLHSITPRADLPRSMRPAATESKTHGPYAHIRDKKLKAKLHSQVAQASQAKALRQDATTWLAAEPGGKMEVETELERTWRTTQAEIVEAVGFDVATGRREWKWDLGPYRPYGRRWPKGHVITSEWQENKIHSEIQLRETVRDITFLQDHTMYAVAQKKYAFIYDQNGVELHRLKSIVEPTRLEFLPYHWLLASIGNAGYLKYLDTSTGTMVAEQRTKLGACNAMTQNIHNAVIYLGHQNGTVALHTPSTPTPLVRLQAHLGPITSLSVDPSSGGRYLATAGQDSRVKIWDCRNWKGCVREWTVRGGAPSEVEWSRKGWLGVIGGGSINVYASPSVYAPAPHPNSTIPPSLYLTHPIPHRPLVSMRFCPFQDAIAIGHARGVSSIVVPGSGEANIDSFEDGVFENKKARQEREVRSLLDKFMGRLAEPGHVPFATPELPFRQKPRLDRLRDLGKADESPVSEEEGGDVNADEGGEQASRPKEKDKMKMRGKGKSLKRYLRKKRKNVVDPSTVAIREKIAKMQAARKAEARQKAGLPEKELRLTALDHLAITFESSNLESNVFNRTPLVKLVCDDAYDYATVMLLIPNLTSYFRKEKHMRNIERTTWQKLCWQLYDAIDQLPSTMVPQYEAMPLQVPLPQLSKQDFELKIEGVGSIDQNPLQEAQVYERAHTTHIADVEEVSQVLFQSTSIVFGTEDNPSHETITEPRVLSHVFNVPSHMPSALQSKRKRAQVIWKLVFKVYRKAGAFKREYIAHEAKFPAIKSYLPIPGVEHEAPLTIGGDSPKGDISWLLSILLVPPRSLYAPGDTTRASLVLTAKPGHSIKSQLRSVQLELTEYVVASGEPDVLIDTLYRNKVDTSGSNIESKEGCSFDFDLVVPSKSSPDYTGTFMSVTHRLQVTTTWKGRLLDKVTSHPVVIAALSHSERQRAIEEVALVETAPSIAPPSLNDDIPPPSYISTQRLVNGSFVTLMAHHMEDEMSSISYRSNIDTPTTGSVVHSTAG